MSIPGYKCIYPPLITIETLPMKFYELGILFYPGVYTIPIIMSSKVEIYKLGKSECVNSIISSVIPVIDKPSIRSTFIGNVAHDSGGAIYVNNNKFSKIVNVVFHRNEAHSNGGAICFAANNHGTVLVNIKMTENIARSNGGGIYFGTFNTGIQIHNSSFVSNRADLSGGAISFQMNNGKIT